LIGQSSTGSVPPVPSAIQDEIRQRRPFAHPAEEAVVALFRTADLVRRRLAREVEPRGLTLQQYNVLRILRGAGAAGLPTLEIAGRMIEEAPGVTRLLDRLERKGLVARERCPADRRQVTCRITRAGLAILRGLDAAMPRAAESALAGLDARRTRELIHLMDAVRTSGGPAAAPTRRTKR
jgi:DNA-binding MarR family transcriptional regulator